MTVFAEQAGRQRLPDSFFAFCTTSHSKAFGQVNLAAVSANGIALQWAPVSCRASNPRAISSTSSPWLNKERFKKDKGVALAAVTSAGHALKYVDKDR